MANSRDFTGKNRKFTGTTGIILPKGTTGERVSSNSGEIRFNTTTNSYNLTPDIIGFLTTLSNLLENNPSIQETKCF